MSDEATAFEKAWLELAGSDAVRLHRMKDAYARPMWLAALEHAEGICRDIMAVSYDDPGGSCADAIRRERES